MVVNCGFTDNSKDYIVKTWQWIDCSKLGAVDSVFFTMLSSDTGSYGINNPTYFCMDNFTTSSVLLTDLDKVSNDLSLSLYPNPVTTSLRIHLKDSPLGATVRLVDISGKIVMEESVTQDDGSLDLTTLQAGIYFLEVNSGNQKTIKKLIKN